MAVNLCAGRRGLAIFASESAVALALATIHTVHVSCLSMARAMEFFLACWRSATVSTAVELAIWCLHALALASIGLVHILCGAVSTTVIVGITRWRHSAIFAGPTFGAGADTAIVPVPVCCDSMTVAVPLVVAWVRNGTVSTFVSRIPFPGLALTDAAICAVQVSGGSMTTAMGRSATRRWNCAGATCVSSKTVAITTIGFVLILSLAMSAAVFIRITRGWH